MFDKDYTDSNAIRDKLIHKLIGDDDENLDKLDGDDMSIILTALKHKDQQMLTRQRMQEDNSSAEADRNIALAIAGIHERDKDNMTNPFLVGAVPDKDDSKLPQVELVDGELDEGVVENTYDKFISDHEDENGRYIDKK